MLQKSFFLTLMTLCVALRFKLDTDLNLEFPAFCTLEKMQRQIYMFAMLRTSELRLNENFLNHYKKLGVDMNNHLHLVIHTETSQGLYEMQTMFKRIGVTPRIETISWYASTMKRTLVNAWIKTLPKDAWVIYPDADEFFSYPCIIYDRIREGKDCFSARMADRIGQNYTIQEMTVSTNMHELNPMKCPNMREHFGAWSFKQILFKAYGRSKKPRHMKNSHEAMADLSTLQPLGMEFEKSEITPGEFLIESEDRPGKVVPSYDTGTFFDHYFWTSRTVKELMDKVKTYKRLENQHREIIYENMLEVVDSNGRLNKKGLDIFAQVCFYDP